MPPFAIALLAAGTYAFRVTGPVFRHRLRLPPRLERLLPIAAAVLLIALTATSTLAQGHGFGGWARLAGVAAGGLLAARRAPFPLVIITAAVVTALLRLMGLP